jgi:ribosomal protein L30/L7E
MEYPAGTYALATLDDFNQENVFWNIAAQTNGSSKRLTVNLTNFSLGDTSGETIPSNATMKLYALSADGSGGYYQDRAIGDIKLSASKTASMSLAADPYLVVYTGQGNQEYGQAFYASNGSIQNVKVVISSKTHITDGQKFSVSVSANYGVTTILASAGSATTIAAGGSLANRLKGRILLQTQAKGQAWYVNPVNGKRYYLGRPTDAFNVMRSLGLGISNADFNKLAAQPNSALLGRILIKTQDSGRAYYYNPVNRQLYYLGRPTDAFNVMRSLGLGITNSDLNQIAIGN